MENRLKEFKTLTDTLYAKNHLLGVMIFDGETIAPIASADARSKSMSVINEEIFKLLTSPSSQELINYLYEKRSSLDEITQRELTLIKRSLKLLKNMPMNEYVEYQSLLNKAQVVWSQAKKANDYEMFKPYLEKIIEYNKKIAAYYAPEKEPYDALLEMYEYGMSMADYDPFFDEMQKQIVPTLKEISNKPLPEYKFLSMPFSIEKQKILSDRIMDLMGLDRTCCSITESEHPFTTGFNKWDLRITTHYYENMFESSLYSVIHEGGHAMYEMGIDDKYQFTNIAGGASLGMHESQSRFYENIIGRSKAFMSLLHPIICDIFPEQMKGVSEETLYKALNLVHPSLIRIEADELSYSLHILIRYEIEKMLISGELNVDEAPKYWNKLYKDYLGVDVPDYRSGILQDIHWAGGSIGYFPTYALGSAYGAQMLAKMNESFDINKDITENKIQNIHKWLNKNIHVHGSMYDPKKIISMACKEEFNPQYYFDYLNNKFKDIYEI